MIIYTSGSTGTPKGAMYTERMVCKLWTWLHVAIRDAGVQRQLHATEPPRRPVALVSSFMAGGTSYFVAESDLSTLFEDWTLVRPTEMALVPRVVDMLFQRYRGAVDRRVDAGPTARPPRPRPRPSCASRSWAGACSAASSRPRRWPREMQDFLDQPGRAPRRRLRPDRDRRSVQRRASSYVRRSSTTSSSTSPNSATSSPTSPIRVVNCWSNRRPRSPGYYKRPEVTAEVFDADGYYRTGDVMAEIAPDRLEYVDRRNNVLKLAQGEFVAVARLEAIFAGAPLVRQIFVYGNSERANLLAVIVPTADALRTYAGDPGALKAALSGSLQRSGTAAELQSYEIPVDFLVETEPFSAANGLLSGVGKILRPKLKAHYGERLEQLYADLAAARVDELRALREAAVTARRSTPSSWPREHCWA